LAELDIVVSCPVLAGVDDVDVVVLCEAGAAAGFGFESCASANGAAASASDRTKLVFFMGKTLLCRELPGSAYPCTDTRMLLIQRRLAG
jgi:hypothetical protein